ncbi:TetR family transcriptional regulator [bacterium]|nr:MAG: TetR family transcriptional regulator [bacterium]
MVHTLPGRVARRRTARKEEIFSVALRLAEREGREGLGVHRLAEALDLTPGALYRYFPSKNHFLAELQAHVQERVLELFMERRADWDDGPLDALLGAADFYLSLEKTAPRYAILLGLLIGDPRRFQEDEGIARVAPSARALLAALEGLFAQAENAGVLASGDRREKTLAYWAALHGATHLMKLEKVEPGLRDNRYYGLRLARTLLAGWGAPRAALARAWGRRGR